MNADPIGATGRLPCDYEPGCRLLVRGGRRGQPRTSRPFPSTFLCDPHRSAVARQMISTPTVSQGNVHRQRSRTARRCMKVVSAKLQPGCSSDRCELLLAEAPRTAGAMRVANYKPLVLSVSCRACQLRRLLCIAKVRGTNLFPLYAKSSAEHIKRPSEFACMHDAGGSQSSMTPQLRNPSGCFTTVLAPAVNNVVIMMPSCSATLGAASLTGTLTLASSSLLIWGRLTLPRGLRRFR